MKKFIFLMIAPMLASLASCGNHLPPRKMGEFVNVTFIGHEVDCNCPTYAPIDRDLELKLDILYEEHEETKWAITPTKDVEGVLEKPNKEYVVSVDDIHVKIGGTEYPDSFTFFYQNNAKNLLTIKKEYMVNDVDIEVTAKSRGVLFLFGYELGEELESRWYGYKEATNPDLFITFKTPYQQVRQPIKTLDGQPAFPVFEHDDIDVTFEVDSKKIAEAIEASKSEVPVPVDYAKLALPYDLRYRCNARYTYENIDYTREYSEPFGGFYDEEGNYRVAYAKCHFKVPHYIVNDHGSFRQFGTE